jgi:hypothetical protein
MTADQIRSALRKTPFQPFTLHTQSGESYKITHPETMWVSRNGETVIVDAAQGIALMGSAHVTEVVYARGRART